jgi:hypothetical protein
VTAPRQPATRLDARFSDPDAAAGRWDETLAALRAAPLWWITTVRADGRPHVTPLVAVWLEDALHFATGPGEQKARNLAADPRVALTTGCNEWEGGVDVVVEGTAVRVLDDPTLQRLAAAWASTWDGRWRFEVRDGAFHHDEGGEALVFAVRPSKVLAFGKQPFRQTRHTFR